MGIAESAKGAIKEKVGDLTNNTELEQEGSAQRAKGDEQTAETKDRAEAKAHEAKAEALQDKQDALES